MSNNFYQRDNKSNFSSNGTNGVNGTNGRSFNRFSSSGSSNGFGNNKQKKNEWNFRPSNYQYTSKVPKPPVGYKVLKNFYHEDSVAADRSNSELNRFYHENEITVHGSTVPNPVFDFPECGFPDKITEGIRMLGYQKPTPIQAVSWPIALSGRDLVGIAQTGSGKTLSYILPAFIHIEGQPERKGYGPMCLVLAPTRELAQQIHAVVCNFTYNRSVCVFGGASKGPQIRDIRNKNPTIVIACPGRLIDFIESGIIHLANISYLVLDEADRMLDMGFEPQIKKIIEQIPKDRQTLMWSATWPKEVRALAEAYLHNYVHINIGSLSLCANHNITQIVDVCDDGDKAQKLYKLLADIGADRKENKTIIFAETKRKVDDLTRQMRNTGWPSMCIHGDKSQQERDWVLNEFKTGRYPILVATDVAARGLDVDDIKFVINYDYPNSSEDYVHRIGRTGRMDKRGTAYTFFTYSNQKQANELIDVLKEANQIVNPQLYSLAGSAGRSGKRGNNNRRGPIGGIKRKFDGNQNGIPSKRMFFEGKSRFDCSEPFFKSPAKNHFNGVSNGASYKV